MADSLRRVLAGFILGETAGDPPAEVLHQARRCLLDFLGVALAGGRTGLAPLVADLALAQGGRPEAGLIGRPERLPAVSAALVNAVRGHALDLDDGHRYANAHPGVATIPAALALAELAGRTGRELLAAVAAGAEVLIRLGTALNPGHLGRGFHTTATLAPLASAAAGSRLLGLAPAQAENALALAGLQAAGLLEALHSGQTSKPFQVGRGVQSGVLAARLAQAGAEGPELVFEGPDGFFRAYAAVPPDLAGITAGLGREWRFLGVYFKRFAACRHVHAALDAAQEIVRRHGLDPRSITALEVETYSVALDLTGRNAAPESGPAAKFSLAASLGLLLTYGQAGPEIYVDERLDHPLVQSLAAKVTARSDPGRDARYPRERSARVVVRATSGEYAHEVKVPKGDAENPLSDAELAEKFRANAGPVLGRERALALERLVLGLDGQPVAELLAALVP